jgi:hypothetical protein
VKSDIRFTPIFGGEAEDVMKRFLTLTAILSVQGLMVGCVTIPTAQTQPQAVVDEVRVERIERAARHAGLRVYWLNKPTVQVPAQKS